MFKNILKNRKTFLIYAVVSVGIPGAVGALFFLRGFTQTPWFGLYVIAVVLLVSLLWGFVMWELFFKHRLDNRD